jgi:hypothetical protein
MIARGLAYRNDGPEVAEMKLMAYENMLQRYPPDATTKVCRTLRPSGWMPSVDTLEAEIIEIIRERSDILNALNCAEILTEEQIHQIDVSRKSFALSNALSPFPFFENGKQSAKDRHKKAKVKLESALSDFLSVCPEPNDFIYDRLVKEAKTYLSEGMKPLPARTMTAKERTEFLKAEEERLEKSKRAKIKELKSS